MTNKYPESMVVNQSFSLTLEHTGKLIALAERLGIKKSEVIRLAIDALYESQIMNTPSTETVEAK